MVDAMSNTPYPVYFASRYGAVKGTQTHTLFAVGAIMVAMRTVCQHHCHWIINKHPFHERPASGASTVLLLHSMT